MYVRNHIVICPQRNKMFLLITLVVLFIEVDGISLLLCNIFDVQRKIRFFVDVLNSS